MPGPPPEGFLGPVSFSRVAHAMGRASQKEIAVKKTTLSKKLMLSKETLSSLTNGEMKGALGGANDTIVRPSDACGTPTGG